MKNPTFSIILSSLIGLFFWTGQVSGQTRKPVFELVKIWETDTIFKTPESVRYHPAQNLLYISNVNAPPVKNQTKGFISLMDTEGKLIKRDWVTGLKGPKGMGIYGNKLYVTDIDQLVIINISEARITDRIPVEGAGFLNDLAVDKSGLVYFTDSKNGKIHKYENGVVTEWITEGLKGPNGLYIEEDRILLTSASSADLKIINPKTGEFEVVCTELGAGDGVEFTGYKGYYLISDWNGEVFLIRPDFTKESLLRTKEDKIYTADLGLNPAKHIVYVPTFFNNRVVAYKIVKK